MATESSRATSDVVIRDVKATVRCRIKAIRAANIRTAHTKGRSAYVTMDTWTCVEWYVHCCYALWAGRFLGVFPREFFAHISEDTDK